jgi:hypothetical protein
MKSKFITLSVVLILIASSALTVWAGLHFSGGAGFGSGSVRIHTELVGVSGGRTATITTTISDGYNLTAVCRNKGGNIAYGQNPVNISNITVVNSANADSNGNAVVDFHIDVIQAAGISAVAAGCPNGNWKVSDLLGHLNVTLTASDGTFVDTLTYSCFVNDVNHVVACTPTN